MLYNDLLINVIINILFKIYVKIGGMMRMKRILIICAIAFGIITIIACGGAGVDSSKAEKVGENTESTDTTTETEVDQIFKIGEAIKLGNAELTVLGMEKVTPGPYDTKKPGKEFIAVNVKLKNVGVSDRIRFDSLDFKVEDSKGIITDKAYLSSVKETESVELAPNAEVTGKIPFEVDVNDNKLTLEYRENMFLDDVIRVKLNW